MEKTSFKKESSVKDGAIEKMINEPGNLAFLLTLSAFIVIGMQRANKRGYQELKDLPAMAAIKEAIGRATELGRPIHFTVGWSGIREYTIQGLALLPYIIKLALESGAHLICTTPRPNIFIIFDDLLKTGYSLAGAPESEIDLRYLAGSGNAYVIAMQGMMLRERPGANFLFGLTGAETIVHAETGQRIGAMQVGGTSGTWNLPFMVVICDYTLIGEEFVAASAIASGDLSNLGGIVGQDWGRAVIIVVLIIGPILIQIGSRLLLNLLNI